MPQALDALAGQTRDQRLRGALHEISLELQEGVRLSEAFRARRQLLPSYFPDLLLAAEESGSMDEILRRIELQVEQDIALRRELLSASLYPCFVCLVASAVGLLVLLFVVPAFQELFAEFGAELPLVTRVALSLSKAAKVVMPLGICAAILSALGAQTMRGKATVRRVVQKIPVYGLFLSRSSLACITGTLATMVSCGLPLARALELVSHTAGSDALRDELQHFSSAVLEGLPLSVLVRGSTSFPPELWGVLEVGETSGALDEVLRSLSITFQAEARDYAAILKASVEPLLVSILGLFVGGLMVAVYLPIFGLGGLTR